MSVTGLDIKPRNLAVGLCEAEAPSRRAELPGVQNGPPPLNENTDPRLLPPVNGSSGGLYLAADLTGRGHFSDEFLRGSGLLFRFTIRRLVRTPGRGRLRSPCLRHPAIRPPVRITGRGQRPPAAEGGVTQVIAGALTDTWWTQLGITQSRFSSL